MAVTVYTGAALARYGFGDTHPFGTDRLDAFWQEAVKQGLNRRVAIAAPVACSDADLLRFHTPAYLDFAKNRSDIGSGYLDAGDTPAFPGIYTAGATVVGSTLAALGDCMRGGRAFVPIAGLHHARRDGAAGFCAFNDIGVAIETLRATYGVRRIAYVDIDAHHGDGVFYAYEDDPDLIFVDVHEDGRFLYPGTGAQIETGRGAALGTKLNLPLAPGADDAQFFALWPRIEEFVRAGRPEIILLQAGADSIAGDPIAHLGLTPAAHAHAARRLSVVATELGHGRLLAFGGGGYNRRNLALAWTAVVAELLKD